MVQMRGNPFVCLDCRHWLVITEDGHMVTGRQEPRLVLVSLTSEEGHVCLNGPNMEELRFPIKHSDNPVISCRFISLVYIDFMLWPLFVLLGFHYFLPFVAFIL